jgi:hypothetical protein
MVERAEVPWWLVESKCESDKKYGTHNKQKQALSHRMEESTTVQSEERITKTLENGNVTTK